MTALGTKNELQLEFFSIMLETSNRAELCCIIKFEEAYFSGKTHGPESALAYNYLKFKFGFSREALGSVRMS